ncbi:Uncharacterised protein [Enterobacter kobei]|nr:Uncharacterised protein [Enterobacter kobei]
MLRYLTGKTFCQSLEKQWHTNTGLSRKPDPNRFVLFISVDTRFEILQHIDLVHHQQRGNFVGINLFQHHVHRVDVLLHAYVSRINHVQQQGRLSRLLQRRFKRRHQIVWQMADKPYGIRQHRFTHVCYVNTTQRRIQGRKQLVCGINLGLGYLVKQGGFTGVGITHQRHGRDVSFGSRPTPLFTLFLYTFQTREDLGNTATQ